MDQERLYQQTGGRTNQQHILPRLLWVREHEPYVWQRTWTLIEGDMKEFGISPSLFPPVHPSMEQVGFTVRWTEQELRLPEGVPVIAGSADHVASTLADGITKPGDLLIKFGGAGDILYCVDEIRTSPRLFFDYHIVPGNYLLNGCMAASGSLVKWFVKDIIDQESPDIFKKLDQEAEKAPAASEGLLILPYFLGESVRILPHIPRLSPWRGFPGRKKRGYACRTGRLCGKGNCGT